MPHMQPGALNPRTLYASVIGIITDWKGGSNADKEMPRGAPASTPEPVHHGLTYIDRNRHGRALRAHALDQDLAGLPVAVVEPDGDDLFASQTGPGHGQLHRMVATGDGGASPGRRQNTLNLFCGKVARRSRWPRWGNARDRESQVAIDPAGGKQQAEQRPQESRPRSCSHKAPSVGYAELGIDVSTGDGIQVAKVPNERRVVLEAIIEQLGIAHAGEAPW